MIIDIPGPEDFQSAGLNQIYLAWQITINTIIDFETAQEYARHSSFTDTKLAEKNYWNKTQPVLANALALTQQSIEMAIKGRIAEISPYLLISRDPNGWPSRVETESVPFSDFRSLDAADLVKVHNSVSPTPLDKEFTFFWNELRAVRNKLMHSVSPHTFEAALVLKSILVAISYLFNDMHWPKRLIDMEFDDRYSAYGLGGEFEHNTVMMQIDSAMRFLNPADKKKFFGLEKRRTYLCPSCRGWANIDFDENLPKLAQLSSRKSGCTTLRCVVCAETHQVVRKKCAAPQCKGDVIFGNLCLTCQRDQENVSDFEFVNPADFDRS